ncbi:septation ring formation regulator EzrA [Bacillus sp. 2205SS5-2]|uniref:septation ring formation regulator EzrA n=1 Tax=Bacillus sp. 2205SS5-2 TaxID=3109031 RepID=UPI003003AD56
MELLIGGIVLVIIIFSISTFFRRKHYREIDALEGWKVDIMNRPVLEEMSKVKQLNMTGQTEDLFEKWRGQWEEIVAVSLPEVEELLLDAEEYADKFRFNKAKFTTTKVSVLLEKVEKQIDVILEELSELIGSEEKNREEIEELSVQFHDCRKQLLAHRHQFGEVAAALEQELLSIKQAFDSFDQLTTEGNYLEARELVLNLKLQYENLALNMERTPDFLAQCQNIIPSQLEEILDGYIEMKEQGYVLDHLEINHEVQKYIKELEEMKQLILNLDVEKVEGIISSVKEKIDSLYDLLEQEVHSKHFIMQNEPKIKLLLDEVRAENAALKINTDFVQQGYQLENDELDVPQKLEKQLKSIVKRFSKLENELSENEAAFSFIGEELQKIGEELDVIHKSQTEFAQHLQNLRKDEIEAREKIQDLKQQLSDARRLVSKSNVPGLSVEHKQLLDQAKKFMGNVIESLNEKPLNMKSVNQNLEQTADAVQHFYTKTKELVEQVLLAEKVIQYGNRYRSRYELVEDGLRVAEEAFRRYEYQEALEQAAAAVERVEPGALKRIESWINEESS